MFNIDTIINKITQLTNKNKFLIAYSGGMDSHVLLHCMQQIRHKNPQIKLRAIHIHHGLSPNADSWATHCQNICTELNIELIVKSVDINSNPDHHKHSLEALAREARYQEFAHILTAEEDLLTAHHADDQAETILLQLFRGCGPKGLAAMPEYKPLGLGLLLRPLLEFNRADLHTYAKQNVLHWICDESNELISYDRNFMRHKLMPIITARWPKITATLARSANHCAHACDLLDNLAQQDYLLTQGSKINTLSVGKILALSQPRQNNLIRYWLQRLKLSIPSSIKLQHIISDVLHARTDAKPIVHWHNTEIRRYRDDLYAMSPLANVTTPDYIIPWDGATNLKLPNNMGIIPVEVLKKHAINNINITVRFRCKGDKCKVQGRIGTHSLKKLLQEKGIPPWQRNHAPLIFQNEKLIHIFDKACQGKVKMSAS
jgi:tRNA(Ile)-lysidine synthase